MFLSNFEKILVPVDVEPVFLFSKLVILGHYFFDGGLKSDFEVLVILVPSFDDGLVMVSVHHFNLTGQLVLWHLWSG